MKKINKKWKSQDQEPTQSLSPSTKKEPISYPNTKPAVSETLAKQEEDQQLWQAKFPVLEATELKVLTFHQQENILFQNWKTAWLENSQSQPANP